MCGLALNSAGMLPGESEMDSLTWETVAEEFVFDGSWRDIYMLDTDIDAWQRVLDQLRRTEYDLVYRRGGDVCELPRSAPDAFPVEGMADRYLSVKFADVLANCHFFTREEIEFDIDPREVNGQRQLDALLTFMRLLCDATDREVTLTPENSPEIVIFRALPGQPAIEYCEFGGWR